MDMFDALGDPTRRSIIELLATQGTLPATSIFEHFPVSAPAISQHLKVLREAKLVDMEKRSQQRLYSLNTNRISEVSLWAEKIQRQWDSRLNKLDALLKGGT